MAVKRYNGSSWDVVAGLGAQGPAATSSSIATWVKTASGGETSLSGNDDNSQSLSYTVGQELVFINGTLLKRGSDYTATNGTSITGLTALAANDVATVWTVNAFSVTNAISNTIVNAKGDLIVATGADTPGILTAGTTGQVLTVDSTTGTGLKWATPAAGGKVLQVVSAFKDDAFTTTSTTYVDVTGLSATLTPATTSSKILIMVSIKLSQSTASERAQVTIKRGTTEIANSPTGFDGFCTYNLTGSPMGVILYPSNIVYLDSPATTSSTTYKVQLQASAGTATVNREGHNSTVRGTSSITVLEIGA